VAVNRTSRINVLPRGDHGSPQAIDVGVRDRSLLAGEGSLHQRLEAGLREAIRSGRLRAGHVLPSTRGLAADLSVSRGVVVEAYAQLRAEGWLEVRPGASHRVAAVSLDPPASAGLTGTPVRPRHDLRPGGPDPLLFPRTRWAAAVRAALREADVTAFEYPDVLGAAALRRTLAAYLARVRGVRAEPDDVVVCAGVGHALALVGRALHAAGARRVAVEDPSHTGTRAVLRDVGLELTPTPVDDYGIIVDALPTADAVLVTPAHQFPTGAVLHPDRRAALVAWARHHDAVILEDDYDAEYRYDRHPIGALQGLDPDRVVYCGSVSKTLSPALRMGWAVMPPRLRGAVATARERSDLGTATLDQLALARFIELGEYDRHLRRSRAAYRRRRDVLVAALHEHLGAPQIEGVAAGLHLVLEINGDERAAVEAAEAAGIGLAAMAEHVISTKREPALILGYGRVSESALRAAAALLAETLEAEAAVLLRRSPAATGRGR
jgi:GntR family transcriptional regulator/MocR family aminotransferase